MALSNKWLGYHPGYILYVDLNFNFVFATNKTAKIFGFDNLKNMLQGGYSEINCPAAAFAEDFIEQDRKTLKTEGSLKILDTRPYVDSVLKTFLFEKTVLRDENNQVVGVSCTALEMSGDYLKNFLYQITRHTDRNVSDYGQVGNVYLGAKYDEFGLSARESQCLYYMLQGKSSKAISKALNNISYRTVEKYIEHIKDKMHCNSKSEIVEKAIAKGYLNVIPSDVLNMNVGGIFIN